MPTDTQSKALQLVNHTRDLYAAILRARSETSGLVLKDMGDAIYDAIAWEDLATPVKQALVIITRELLDANTQNAIRDIEAEAAADAQTSIVYERPNKEKTDRQGGAFTRFGSDEIENEEALGEFKLEESIDEADFIQSKGSKAIQAAPVHSEIRESQETLIDVEAVERKAYHGGKAEAFEAKEAGGYDIETSHKEAETEPTEENTRP